MGFEHIVFFSPSRSNAEAGEKKTKLFVQSPFFEFSFWEKKPIKVHIELEFYPIFDQNKQLSVQSLNSGTCIVFNFFNRFIFKKEKFLLIYVTSFSSLIPQVFQQQKEFTDTLVKQQQQFQDKMMKLMGRFGEKGSQNDID